MTYDDYGNPLYDDQQYQQPYDPYGMGAGYTSGQLDANGYPIGTDTANTGSDAHFYQPQAGGTGVQDLGNMGGYGTPQLASTNVQGGGGGPGLGGLVSSLFGNTTNPNGTTSAGVGAGLAGLAGTLFSRGATNVNTPDYTGAANQQMQSGRPNQVGPLGSSTWNGNTQTVGLNAGGQANLDAAQAAQGHAIGALGQDQSAQIQQAQDAAYHKQTAMLDPQYQQQEEQLTSQLANQGITAGSQAYKDATDNFARQRDYAYGNARDSSIAQGDQMQGQLYGQNLQAANSLGSSVPMPSFSATPQTNYIGAAGLQGQGNLNQYNATTQNNNSLTGGLSNLAGSVLSNPDWTSAIGKGLSGLGDALGGSPPKNPNVGYQGTQP